MAEIELIIKVPEDQYELIRRSSESNACAMAVSKEMLMYAVAHGKELPKEYGRLVDADALNITTIETDDFSGNEILDVVMKEDLDSAPTIIESNMEKQKELDTEDIEENIER